MRKAMAAVFLIGIVAFLFIVANAIVYFMVVVFGSETQNMFFLSMELNEEGKEMKSLLYSDNAYGNYMEQLGGAVANQDFRINEATEQDIIMDIEYMGKSCIVLSMDSVYNDISIIGTCPEEEPELVVSEVPAPGARPGELKIMVRMQ